MTPTRVTYQGRQVNGNELEFKPTSDAWATFTLEDGTELRVKLVVFEVVRLEEYSETGEPIYIFKGQQVVATKVPDELKKKPS